MQAVWAVDIMFFDHLFLFFQAKWTNKERVLIFSSRGISYRDRHLMNDLRAMMPHSKSGTLSSEVLAKLPSVLDESK